MNFFRLTTMAVAASVLSFGAAFDHSAWDRVLKSSVNDIGEVDYAKIKAGRKDLDEYVRLLGESSPVNKPELFPSRSDELAYWMNAYNAFVMRGVVDKYPTRSVRDLGALYGFFRRKDYVAGGEKMSLQHLENEIIRKNYNEPRIHFGIVCASVSCPLLSKNAFTAANLEEQLERLARNFINQRRNVAIDKAGNEIVLSAIFDWYKKDFETAGAGDGNQALLAYVRRYANEENRRALAELRQLKVKFRDYDWSINAPGARSRSKDPLERELVKSEGAVFRNSTYKTEARNGLTGTGGAPILQSRVISRRGKWLKDP